MSIMLSQDNTQFQLNTQNTSYIMAVYKGYLLHYYYGSRIDGADCDYMRYHTGRASFSTLNDPEEPAFSLDTALLEYPCWGRGDLRSPALELQNSDGSNIVDPTFESCEVLEGKPALPGLPASYAQPEDGVQTLRITLADRVSGIRVHLYYAVFPQLDVITRWVQIENGGEGTVRLTRALSACLELDHMGYDLITNYGAHARERQLERAPLRHGVTGVYSRRGASSHCHNPNLVLVSPRADEENGEAYGMALVYSGSHLCQAEGTMFGTPRLLMGIHPDGFCWQLSPGEVFTTPEVLMTYSGSGIGQMSRNLHQLLRTRVCRGRYRDLRRPVVLNSWEACYFDFDEEKLIDIGRCAAGLGVELLVVDDGWFGRRDDDTTSLGDWYIDRHKLPGGIDRLADELHKVNCRLGIWFEPEMVSPDSDLYRAHPDWALHIEGRPASQGRRQLMLDLSRPEVCDYLYQSVAAILKTGKVDYVKWDFNRNMAEVGSVSVPAGRQGEVPHRYMLGLYSLLERLTGDFPNVLFESCSGGGGRFDAGMLYYMPQTWTSDNSDAIERLKIQYGTSMIYPLSAITGHVSAAPNHQTGHVTSFATRAAVALTGSFGYELDPTKLSDEDKEAVKESAALYKQYGDLFVGGDYYRLRSPYEGNNAAWCFVSPDKSRVFAAYVRVYVECNGENDRLTLSGLDPAAAYRETRTGQTFTGSMLMHYGLKIDQEYLGEYQCRTWIFERV